MKDIKIQKNQTTIAVVSHYQAIKDRALSDLELYLNRPVGVGGHATTLDEVILMLEKLEKSDSMINLLNSITTSEDVVNKEGGIGSSGEMGSNKESSDK